VFCDGAIVAAAPGLVCGPPMVSVLVCWVAACFRGFGGAVQSVYKVGRVTSQTSASSGAREALQQTLQRASERSAVFRLFTVRSWQPTSDRTQDQIVADYSRAAVDSMRMPICGGDTLCPTNVYA
jgi:hypothetical protein